MRYEIEESTDLRVWIPAWTRQTRTIPIADMGYETVSLVISEQSVQSGELFYRLRIVR